MEVIRAENTKTRRILYEVTCECGAKHRKTAEGIRRKSKCPECTRKHRQKWTTGGYV